jgi:tRNA nucleotidyltransferase (CCA-adding enzyme)
MDTIDYLNNVLAGQDLEDESPELKELQEHRKDVEKLLRDGFPEAAPTIRYGGSKAKGTLIKESYDLDIICYFRHEDKSAGESLEEIYNNVKDKLSDKYQVEPKTSAIRLKGKDLRDLARDFHIDVVPGRFVDKSKTDCHIHQAGGDKDYLKTNLDVHIAHVRDSGVVPAIRLLKLWKTRRNLRLKLFVFELLVIEILRDKKKTALDAQVKYVWERLRDLKDPIKVEDPANPTGNVLADLLRPRWAELSMMASATLELLDASGWEAVFGKTDDDDDNRGGRKIERLRSAAAAIPTPTKPWLSEG